MSAHLELDGMDTLTAVLRSTPKKVTVATASALTAWSYEVFALSQKQVPVHFGVLKASGHVEEPVIDGPNIEITIGYGGAAAQYALWVHENLAAVHKPPTKAKFLEDPINTLLPQLSIRLRDSIESAIVGQYPQSPSHAQQAESDSDQRSARTKTAVAKNRRGMSADEVHAALRSIDADRGAGAPRRWHRAGS